MKAEPWYINHYHCDNCNVSWSDEWDCTCDDKCPQCDGSYSPEMSEDINIEVVA